MINLGEILDVISTFHHKGGVINNIIHEFDTRSVVVTYFKVNWDIDIININSKKKINIIKYILILAFYILFEVFPVL